VFVHSNFIIYRQPCSFAAQSERSARDGRGNVSDNRSAAHSSSALWNATRGRAKAKGAFCVFAKSGDEGVKVTQKEETFERKTLLAAIRD
jgi:hypothetical protein